MLLARAGQLGQLQEVDLSAELVLQNLERVYTEPAHYSDPTAGLLAHLWSRQPVSRCERERARKVWIDKRNV